MTQRRAVRGSVDRRSSLGRPLIALVTNVLVILALVQPAHGDDTAYGPIGTLVAPHSSGVMLTDLATGAQSQVAVLPPVGIAGHAAWSPDGTRIAISRFGRTPGDRAGGSDILVVPGSGGEAVPVAVHDADGALLGVPAWLPDGTGLFFDHLPPNSTAADTRIMFARVDQSQTSPQSPQVIAEGSWPAVSPDGRYLAFVRARGTSGFLNELVLAPLDGAAGRVLVPADQFVQIDSPRFSPDGAEIAFVGSLTRGEAGVPAAMPGLLAKSVMAHGPPGDVWLLDLYGGFPRQMTAFEEDEPTLAWSPDGRWILMLSGGGLYLVTHDGSEAPRRFGPGGFGGIDWH